MAGADRTGAANCTMQPLHVSCSGASQAIKTDTLCAAQVLLPPLLHHATALPSRRWRRARAVRPMCVQPAASHDHGGTSTCGAARATRPPSPAGTGGGCTPCCPCVCRRRRVAIAAGRARAVPPARRDRPSWRWRRARAGPPICVPPAASHDLGRTSTRCAARATRPPSPPVAGGGCAQCGSCVCRRRRVAITAGRARSVPPTRRDRHPYRPFLCACCIHSMCRDSASKHLRLATPCHNAPGHVSAPLCMLLSPHPPGEQLPRLRVRACVGRVCYAA